MFEHLKISIHALREEGDSVHRYNQCFRIYFNPRPPRGGRQFRQRYRAGANKFQSTPSARRATGYTSTRAPKHTISIHALREEGDRISGRRQIPRQHISIHALREEGDCRSKKNSQTPKYFNPRPPRGGRPGNTGNSLWARSFQSTPSARRATRYATRVATSATDFNPRPPRGGRPVHDVSILTANRFQSTPSARRATRRQPATIELE